MVKLKLFILALLICVPALAQEVKVIAKTDSANYFVGDYINYELEVTHPENVKIVIPSVQDSLKVLEFIKKENPVVITSGNSIIEKFRYTFSLYDSTEVLIPSFNIHYKIGEDSTLYNLATNELFVFIDKVVVDMQKDVMDIKNPLLIPYDMFILLLIILGIIVLLIVAYFIYKKYKKRKESIDESVPKIIVPPFEEAYTSLRNLEGKELWQNGAVKEYHSEITFIIRKYFERSFNFLALEMPSSEVIENLKSVKECEKIFDETRNFFNNADMVKFAKYIPMDSLNEEMLKQAYNILDNTKPVPVAEEKEEEVQNV